MNRANLTTSIVGIALFGLSAFLLISMVSYVATPTIRRHHAAALSLFKNFCGAVGNFFADKFLNTWGLSALAIPLILVYWGILVFGARKYRACG